MVSSLTALHFLNTRQPASTSWIPGFSGVTDSRSRGRRTEAEHPTRSRGPAKAASQRYQTAPEAEQKQRPGVQSLSSLPKLPGHMLLFGRGGLTTKAYHKSDAIGDQYERYNPANTNMPPAVFHTLANAGAQYWHAAQGKELELFIDGRGHKALNIPWLSRRLPIDQMDYTVFDVETTGLDENARIVQLAAASVRKEHRVDHDQAASLLIHPGLVEGANRPFRIDEEASAIHGITLEKLEGQPTMNDLLPTLRQNNQLSLLGYSRLLVAYNAKFDCGRMNEAIRLYNLSQRRASDRLPAMLPELILDPFVLIQRLHPFNSQKKTLGTVYKILMGAELENKHDAQADVDATIDVLKYTLKYLQKRAIPREWALMAGQLLESTMGPRWRNQSDVEKGSLIAHYVQEHRTAFEQYYPQYTAAPIRAIDVLRFQFGAMSFQDDPSIPYLPVFDITLDQFGLSNGKYWDGTDRLDVDLVQEVRQERYEENLQYLIRLFSQDFPSASMDPLVKDLRGRLKPELTTEEDRSRYERALKKEILNTVAKRVTYKWLKWDKPVPDDMAAASQVFLAEVREAANGLLSELVQSKVSRIANTDVTDALQHHLAPLSEAMVQQTQKLLDTLGSRYFYNLVELDPDQLTGQAEGDILVDPAVLKAYTYAKKKEEYGTPLLYQNPNPALRGQYTPPGVTPTPIEAEVENPVLPKALSIEQPWLDKILSGQKTWEIRGANTHNRGWVALMDKEPLADGRRVIRGLAYLTDTKGPLSEKELYHNEDKHHFPKELLSFYKGASYKKPYAWILASAHRLREPLVIKLPAGAGTWTQLPDATRQLLAKMLPEED